MSEHICTIEQPSKAQELCNFGIAVIDIERKALDSIRNGIDINFSKACEYILACEGRVIVTGMGKSGHIGNKIAATLASTGTPSFFVHPGEAGHGDSGMITTKDCVIAISYSGESDEILTILPHIKRLGIPLICITGNPSSSMAKSSNAHLNVKVPQEACPLGLAPTASTTATLAMGDALAVALLKTRGFTKEDFARSHPGGSLGRRLLILVEDLMTTGKDMPVVHKSESLSNALIEVSAKRLGMTAVIEDKGSLVGIFTDGDLRRAIDKGIDIPTTKIKDIMTYSCKTIAPKALAFEALTLMENNKITALMVVDENKKPLGVLHMHDLIQAKIA